MPKPRIVRKRLRSRKQWAAEISAIHKDTIKRTVQGILKMGRMLIEAKAALAHGEFEKMIASNLPFTASTAQRLMKIARDARLQKAASSQVLPKAWNTLYELTKLPDAAFQQAVTSGAINATMTREQAVRTVNVDVTYRTERIAAPYYPTDDAEPVVITAAPYKTHDDLPPMRLVTSQAQPEPTDASPPDVASLALSQIERLVGDLAMAVERGDVRADAVFLGRIRAVTDRLLCLIEHEAATIN